MTSITQELQDCYYRREGNSLDTFRYFLPDGEPLTGEEEVARLNALGIPPAYTDVFVSPDPEAALQAFGRDRAGRLQYRYHSDFMQKNAEAKWKRLGKFADALPALRTETARDLKKSTLHPRKVLALMTRLLYIARFRVGSDCYVQQHKTYGLTTLLKRHVKIDGNTVEFKFKGKHSIWQHKVTTDQMLARNMARLKELPGAFLFKAETENGIVRLHSHDLNGYIQEVMGPFTAKDFRTWGGTLLAAEFLSQVGLPESDRQARKNLTECVKVVAADLGNTPAVVRGHYISPKVFDVYLEGRILDDFRVKSQINSEAHLTESELALKRLLRAKTSSSK